jgi:putative DNA primase/helicase
LARKSEYFIDSEIPIGKTDAYQNIRGAWIIEIPEIDKLFKYDSSDVKSYITSQVDTYRPSYGRRVLKFQRQCIFTGTTNKYIYFKDVTGNRRFWPVRTSKIDLEALEKDADQLLSEALFLYKNGERWWPSREEQEEVFKLEQKKRMISDSWEEIVWEYINTNNRWKVEVSEILKNVIDLKPSDWNHAHENRVAKILIGFGWERKQLRRKDDPEHRRFYAYIRPIINIESKSSNILEPSEEYDID